MSKSSVPTYRRQRKSPGKNSPADRAFVMLSGKRHYLGRFDSPESRERYAELINPAKNEPLPPIDGPPSVNRVLIAFLELAETYYLDRKGEQSREHGHYVEVARMLREHCGRERAAAFRPKCLKMVRDAMIAKAGLAATSTAKSNGSREFSSGP